MSNNTATTASKSRVRHRDLKVGKVFFCAKDGQMVDMPQSFHSCPEGEPVVIDYIFRPGFKDAKWGVPVACTGKFIHPTQGICNHTFKLCDLRPATIEDWR